MGARCWWVVLFGVFVLGACGGKQKGLPSAGGSPQGGAGSSADQATGGVAQDASASTGGARADAGLDAAWLVDAALAWDGGVPWDALPVPDSGPIAECVGCAHDECAEPIDACVTSPQCARGLVCAGLTCEAEDTECLTQCFQGDPMAVLAGTLAVACLLGQCGEACVSDLSWAAL
jgi:hypothetical protein